MLSTILDWFGFGGADRSRAHGHSHGPGEHGHTHGAIDPTIATTGRGIWAIKWSFAIMAITAAIQIAVVVFSGSVALLADAIHNVGDATTAVPLWIAFVLARRKPTTTFTYGYGRVEDIAGVMIVLIILFSAVVAGYEAISRLVHPQPITALAWVALAGVVGFIGNEAVAVFRIRVGREINSAALIADGYHARTDGLTSLAVVVGALGVWAGFPLADPLIGLVITVAILGIVWQSAKAVFTRMLDGVEPSIVSQIRHAAEHVQGIVRIADVKARWLGHRLHADVVIAVDDHLPLSEANKIASSLREELFEHVPGLAAANVRFDAGEGDAPAAAGHRHHHAPHPVVFTGDLAEGALEIVDTKDGERLSLTLRRGGPDLRAVVVIDRPDGATETLNLAPVDDQPNVHLSDLVPAEPHEFDATLQLTDGALNESLRFHLSEPNHHH